MGCVDPKSASQESSKSAKEQTNALLTAAKANALASRINFYDRQIGEIESVIRERKMQVVDHSAVRKLEETVKQLRAQQRHLAFWLDRQADALGVGLGNQRNDPVGTA